MYTEEEIENVFISIIDLISNGSSLRNAVKEHAISSRTFYEWIKDDENKQKLYARACEERAENIFEDTMDIADYTAFDTMINSDGIEVTNHEVIQRSRLRVDTRKWFLAKLQPKKYGDKLDVTSNNEKINGTIIVQDGKTKDIIENM